MRVESAFKPIVITKAVILLIGVICLGVGLHSHFQSSWVKPVSFAGTIVTVIKPYKICETKYLQDAVPAFTGKSCPHISLEQYFVAMIVICFILSLVSFVAGFLLNLKAKPWKWIDLGYHATAAILLFIAGIVYIVSAQQIHNIFKNVISTNVNFRTSEKLAAGSIAIIQALLNLVGSVLIFKD